MYTRPPISTLLVLTGIATPQAMSPAARTARFMLQIVGIGFGIYCSIAAVLLVATLILRMRRPMLRPAERNGS